VREFLRIIPLPASPIKEKPGKSLLFVDIILRITCMERVEIWQIAAYIKDLEEGLVELDYRGITTLGDLNRLYEIIPSLMDATFKTKDQDLKVILANLEYKARRCKNYIETSLAVKN